MEPLNNEQVGVNNGQVGALTLVHYSEVVLYWGVYIVKAFQALYWQNHRNHGFVEKKWTTSVKMCFYCFMPRFMHAGITCTCIFSSSTQKHQAHLSIIGSAFLLESIIWCTRIVRCQEFRGCLLFRSSQCIESTGKQLVHRLLSVIR